MYAENALRFEHRGPAKGKEWSWSLLYCMRFHVGWPELVDSDVSMSWNQCSLPW